MGLILAIDIVSLSLLFATGLRKGFERALPLAAFLLLIFPNESQIRLPGLFDLTTQRLVIIGLVVLYFTCPGPHRQPGKQPLPLKYLSLILIAWMLLSAAFSVVPVISLKTVLSQILDFFVPYYLYARGIKRLDTVHDTIYAFVTAMTVCSFFGFFEAYWGWSVLSLFPALPSRFSYLAGGIADRDARIQSTFPHAILFGAALAMAIPMAMYLLNRAKRPGQKAFLGGGLLLMFLNLYQTESRGPWIAVALSLGVLLFAGRNRARKYVIWAAILTVAVLTVRPGVRATIFNLYGETVDPGTAQGESYQWRYTLYGVARRELSKNLGRALWGYGPESFYYLGLTTQSMVNGELHTVKLESCDSAVVELLMDTGCIGFLLVAAILFKAAIRSLRSFYQLRKPANNLALIFFANLCAFAFLMTNVLVFGWGQQSYMLWIVIAMAMVYPRLIGAKATFPARTARVNTPAAHMRVPVAGKRLVACHPESTSQRRWQWGKEL